MAGWLTLTNESGFNSHENMGVCRGSGCGTKLDHAVQGVQDDLSDLKVKLRSSFYQFILIYNEGISSRAIIRPLPIMLGDGQPLDLYDLFWVVAYRGGYDVVSKKRLWPLVLQQLGKSLDFLASVKLVYYKYLNGFEGWFRIMFGSKNLKTGFHGCYEKLEKSLPLEFDKTFNELLSVRPNKKRKEDKFAQLASNNIGNFFDAVTQRNQSNLSEPYKESLILEKNDRHDQTNPFKALDFNKQFDSRKRKRVSLSGTLEWIRRVAKSPRHASIGPLPEVPKWRKYKGKELWVQALRAREALLLKRQFESNHEASYLLRQKMHPDMYEDDILKHRTMMKARCRQRLPTVTVFPLCSCCNSFPASNSETAAGSVMTEADSFNEEAMAETSEDDISYKQVSIGPLSQAELPNWTGVVHESDSKWLGTQLWPLKDVELKSAIETNFVGRERQKRCRCPVQCPAECIRFHIAEERIKLKLELGSTFFHWGFHCMGEEVSLHWTSEEEKRFKDIFQSNHHKHFWNSTCKYFPEKARRDLVSYYFNVYVIRRRYYQNRVTPKMVDSDDDESSVGSIGEEVNDLADRLVECPINERYTVL